MFILTPAWLFVNSRVLGAVSGFPDIQFAGVDTLLTRVHASGTLGVIVWYIYIIPGIFYIASTVMLHKVLEPERIPWFGVATTMGVVAWAIQFFGLVRWIFVYPYLANVWVGTNDPRTKETVTIIFNTINNYAGFALGQTIGIHLTALWLLRRNCHQEVAAVQTMDGVCCDPGGHRHIHWESWRVGQRCPRD
jgi:hypothetical protein